MVDVLNDAGGRERLLKLGVRNVPVVAKGDKFVFGQLLENVAEFVGFAGTGQKKLPPEQLAEKYKVILEAAQRLVAQIPAERINERVIPNRDRSLRFLSYHMFRIAEAYLEAWDGAEYTVGIANIPPGDAFQTPQQIVGYGETIRAKFDAWWNRVEDKSCQKPLNTFFGGCPAHDLFERSTWHTAQHCRQLADVLNRFGIEPNRPLTPAQLAGLPLPDRLYE